MTAMLVILTIGNQKKERWSRHKCRDIHEVSAEYQKRFREEENLSDNTKRHQKKGLKVVHYNACNS
jgi:hypothetical protein